MAHVHRAFQDLADSSWRSAQNLPDSSIARQLPEGPAGADARGAAEGGYVL
jgi:hypothetical protein